MDRSCTISDFEKHQSDQIIFRTLVGSRAYGTFRPESDYDSRGIYIVPARDYMTLNAQPDQVADPRGDNVLYALKRFLELASTANPNIIEMLYMPQDCIQHTTPLMDCLISQRELFITQLAYESHVGYARAQIKKARGQNKWVNNPQPESPPVMQDFCWYVPRTTEKGAMPLRPLPLTESPIDLNHCHCSSMEHSRDVYRLYQYGSDAKGVFRNGQIVCESIPKQDEDEKCIGMLIFNVTHFERAQRDHRHYWEWVKNRNPHRWQTQERGEIDYDAKNIMHTFRLLLSGEHILSSGIPLVRFEGEQLAFLKSVLAGEFVYDDLIRMAEEKVEKLNTMREASRLPECPDLGQIDALLNEMTIMWEEQHGTA